MEIHARLTDVFRTVFDNESIDLVDSMTADDIDGWDSIAHVTLIFAIEEEFNIQFSTKELEGFKSVGDLQLAIEKRAS